MPTTHTTISARASALFPVPRAGEGVAILLTAYPAALSRIRESGLIPRPPLPAVALSIWGLSTPGRTNSGTLRSVVRDWFSLGPILAGYWSAGWFAAPPLFFFVAVGFSTAFGKYRALRSRLAVWGAAPHHYGIDGLASIGVAPVCTVAGRRGEPVA